MIFSCCSCLSSSATKSGTEIIHIPDEILEEILGRLSVKDVGRCRLVCSKWNHATLTPHFIQLHLKRGDPSADQSIVLKDCISNRLHVVDGWPRRRARKRIVGIAGTVKLSKKPLWAPPTASTSTIHVCSNVGLVVQANYGSNDAFHPEPVEPDWNHFTVFNPITKDSVEIITPGGEIYGVFFHPVLRQPCVLWGNDEDDNPMQFKLLNLGSNPGWKDLPRPPSSAGSTGTVVIPYKPVIRSWLNGQPTVVEEGNALYWMAEKTPSPPRPGDRGDYYYYISGSIIPPTCSELIIGFDPREEDFFLIPLPEHDHQKRCVENARYFRMNLLVMNGLLSLIQYSRSREPFRVSIWILKDRANRDGSWMKMHSAVFVGAGVPKYFVAAVDGQLLFWKEGERGLFSCNLELGKIRKFKAKGLGYSLGGWLVHLGFARANSLMSLRNSKSEIRMETTTAT